MRRIEPPAPSARAAEDETSKVACFARRLPTAQRNDPLPLRFGDWLVRRELIDRRDLYAALDLCHRRSPPRRLGDALVELAVLDRQLVEEEARAFLSFTTFTVAMSPPPCDDDEPAGSIAEAAAGAAASIRRAPR